ncbi:hypothetical protein [Streptomyces sp. NBC_01320]|uniref:hypothetical protein n=1 Tax=Streptomyces sp. NBC_01320 TaxID=2903824 RepID=UPI002E10A0D2|nr:hypothetical protein OG395_56490 [Streptomyces sp. NBC_01320]
MVATGQGTDRRHRLVLGTAFDKGPVPFALAVVGGIVIGMLLSPTLMAMVVTFGFASQVLRRARTTNTTRIAPARKHRLVAAG